MKPTWYSRALSLILLMPLLLSGGMTAEASQAPASFDCGDVTEIPQAECEALVALYDATDGDNWADNTGWLQTTTPCSWYGVGCSSNRVSSLQLNGNRLSGQLPPEIGDLTALTSLNLRFNYLSSLPTEIGDLIALTSLELSGNYLMSLPAEIGELTALKWLRLGLNRLASLPPEIGELTALRTLNLSVNRLTTLPDQISNLTALRTLNLAGNSFAGTVPAVVWDLVGLTSLTLAGNQLTRVPAEIGCLTALTSLNLESNMLAGLPSDIGQLTALRTLDLGNNQLTTMPAEIVGFSGLRHLTVEGNPLTGEMPTSLTSLSQLVFLGFYDTDWCVPNTEDVLLWLSGISTVYGTGFICGEGLGSLSGRVMADSGPVAGVEVQLSRTVPTYHGFRHIASTKTVADGTYGFADLGQGIGIDYRVRFVDPTFELAPQYYDAKPTIGTADVITITPGIPRTGIDAVLALPAPPTVSVDTETGNVVYSPDGTAQIAMPAPNPSDITVTRTVTCATGTPVSVTLNLSTGPMYPMASAGSDQYQVTIPAADISGNATFSIAATCADGATETIVGYITLYDPSGIVSDDTTGKPVADATVVLYQVPGWEPKTGPDDDRPNTCETNLSKDPDAPWSQPAPTDLGIIVNPEITPTAPKTPYQHATVDGYYGWDVSRGCWYVTVQAEDYEPLTSPVVGVPPDVSDLDLALTPIG
ncbi:MAG: leucine-rich repeat domain-containing protein, partial [Anaerolineae bacterium]